MAQLNFDATQVAPSEGALGAIPAGWYNTLIDNSELKPTKDGTGTYLEIRFAVMDGEYAGRKVFGRLNLRNSNPVAQEIAYRDLSAIAHAVGVLHVQDSQQLHGIPLKIKVSVRAATEQYEASNDIKAYKNINEVVDAGAQTVAAPAMPAPGLGAGAPQMPAQGIAQPTWAPPPAQAPGAGVSAPQLAPQPWQAAAPAPAPMAAPAAPALPPAAPAAGAAPALPPQAPAVPGAPAWAAQQPAGALPPWMQQQK